MALNISSAVFCLRSENTRLVSKVSYRKKTTTAALVAITLKHRLQPIIISKKDMFMALMVSRLSPQVTADDAKESMKGKLRLE
jgi:hypothetical protein